LPERSNMKTSDIGSALPLAFDVAQPGPTSSPGVPPPPSPLLKPVPWPPVPSPLLLPSLFEGSLPHANTNAATPKHMRTVRRTIGPSSDRPSIKEWHSCGPHRNLHVARRRLLRVPHARTRRHSEPLRRSDAERRCEEDRVLIASINRDACHVAEGN